MLKAGSPRPVTQMQALVNTVHAAKRWISGKATPSLKLTLFIPALFLKEELSNAKVKNVVTETTAMTESVTKMVAILLPTAGVTTNSMEKEVTLLLILKESLQ